MSGKAPIVTRLPPASTGAPLASASSFRDQLAAAAAGTRGLKTSERKLVMAVFLPKASRLAPEVLAHLGVLHSFSGSRFFVVFAGYSQHKEALANKYGLDGWEPVKVSGGQEWYFSSERFWQDVNLVQAETTWTYGGNTEVLVFDVEMQRGGGESLPQIIGANMAHFEKTISIGIDRLVAEGVILGFDDFFHAITKFEKEVGSEFDSSITGHVSDRLGVKNGELLLEAFLGAIDRKFSSSLKKLKTLSVLRVKDLRKLKDPP